MVTLLLLCDFSFWRIALVILLSHYVIDVIKLYANPLFENKSIPFFRDQILHMSMLYCCVYYDNLRAHTIQLFQLVDWGLLTAMVFVSFSAAIIMSKLLQKMSSQLEMDHKSLPNAGKYIGIMERILVLAFIILDQWGAIGLLITAKSVFRFNDLKENNSRKLTEYILIGTLMSIGIAIITGLTYLNLNN
jgi:hypothetical protein